MKLLTPMLVLLVALSASAQSVNAYIDPARHAEIHARDAAVYGPGYLTPGNADVYRPGRPVPIPPRRPMPPPPFYGDVGPQMTVRWQDNGVNRLPKFVTETFTIYVGNVLTNEVLVRAIDNRVGVDSALAYLADGRVVPLAALQGSLRQGEERRSLLDYRFSLRVNRIEIRATSDNLIGSRALIQVLVGLAQ